ncbi:MAG: hypothetical protein AB7E32_10255 [Desulfovibrio sp.]
MWRKAFSEAPGYVWKVRGKRPRRLRIGTLEDLRLPLDYAHIQHCLLRPFCEQKDYPLVEARELLPSFEVDLFEYKELPGFSMVIFERPLSSFSEIFQYDVLKTDTAGRARPSGGHGTSGTEIPLRAANMELLQSRLPRRFHETLNKTFEGADICELAQYPRILPLLLRLERGHVLALDDRSHFSLAGIYASFPSDLDSELKRFGLRIGKFKSGDNDLYECNRSFVYQFLMELHGFSIVSERRTSAALFARRLQRMGERFMVRVLGQSDRTITTLSTPRRNRHYPRVEKIALVQVSEDKTEAIELLKDQGFFVDARQRVVILRVTYGQHRFNPKNIQEDRALSVQGQEIIHPLTGRVLRNLNIIKEPSSMILQLNDIVRGEHRGAITYTRNEIIRDPDTHEKRLKFLSSWLNKHQRRIVGYSDEFYSKLVQVLDSYLLTPDNFEAFTQLHHLHQEVWSRFSYIQQTRRIKMLEDLSRRRYKGRRIGYLEMLSHMAEILNDLKFEIVKYFDKPVVAALAIGKRVLDDGYLRRAYATQRDDDLTPDGREIKRLYGRVVTLIDEITAIRKSRMDKNAPSATP